MSLRIPSDTRGDAQSADTLKDRSMAQGIGCEDGAVPVEADGSPVHAGEEPAGLGEDHGAGAVIPGTQRQLIHDFQPPAGNEAEIPGGRPAAPEVIAPEKKVLRESKCLPVILQTDIG